MTIPDFKSEFKKARYQAGLSQAKLADLSGVSLSTIENYEQDVTQEMTMSLYVRCMAVMGVAIKFEKEG